MKKLLRTVPQIGRITWLGRSPARREPIETVEMLRITREHGIEGDHHGRLGSRRQVTLIQAEHLDVIARLLPQDGLALERTEAPPPIDPRLCRRNLVVRGLNLLSLKDLEFALGDEVVLRGTGPCPPCSRMEEELGPGGYQAMRGHGGITAEVVVPGIVRLGDEVRVVGGTGAEDSDEE
jgi:MOSC domain-containing protein YiiM